MLHWAVDRAQDDIVKSLLEQGANVNVQVCSYFFLHHIAVT